MNDKVIKKAVNETLSAEYIASIPGHSGDHVFSDEFNGKMDGLIKQGRRSYSPFVKTAGFRAAAVAAAAVAVCFLPFILGQSINTGLSDNDSAAELRHEYSRPAEDTSSEELQESGSESHTDEIITPGSVSDSDKSKHDSSDVSEAPAAPPPSVSYPDSFEATDSSDHDDNDPDQYGGKDGDKPYVSVSVHEEELRDYLLRDWESLPVELCEFIDEENIEKLAVYHLNNIPYGYKLSSISNSRIFLTYSYVNEADGSLLTFVWGYLTDGDEYLKNAAEIFELEPMPGYEGYYYSQAVDDTGAEIYQIYWSQYGYCFQLNIPCTYINFPEDDNETDRYDFSVKKSYFDIE